MFYHQAEMKLGGFQPHRKNLLNFTGGSVVEWGKTEINLDLEINGNLYFSSLYQYEIDKICINHIE